MSTYCHSDTACRVWTQQVPCLCTQRSAAFALATQAGGLEAGVHPDDTAMRAALGEAARPECSSCMGTGLEDYQHTDAPQCPISNGRLLRVLDAMGHHAPGAGELSLEAAREGIVRLLVPQGLMGLLPLVDFAIEKLGPLTPTQCAAISWLQRTPLSQFPGYDADVEAFARWLGECAGRSATKIWWG